MLATPMIDVESKAGKKFIRKLEELKKELGMKQISRENMKQVYTLDDNLKDHSFLTNFIEHMKGKDKQLTKMLNSLKLKRVFIGDFGRKCGYVNHHIHEYYFRFVIHLGSPEIYYKDSHTEKDRPIPMLNGFGFVISPQESDSTEVTVYPDPIRLINNQKIQQLVPKIRPKDYTRTTLIYDFQFKIE